MHNPYSSFFSFDLAALPGTTSMCEQRGHPLWWGAGLTGLPPWLPLTVSQLREVAAQVDALFSHQYVWQRVMWFADAFRGM